MAFFYAFMRNIEWLTWSDPSFPAFPSYPFSLRKVQDIGKHLFRVISGVHQQESRPDPTSLFLLFPDTAFQMDNAVSGKWFDPVMVLVYPLEWFSFLPGQSLYTSGDTL